MGKKLYAPLILLWATILLTSCQIFGSEREAEADKIAAVGIITQTATAPAPSNTPTPSPTSIPDDAATSTALPSPTPTATSDPTATSTSMPTGTQVPPTSDPSCLDAVYVADVTIPDDTLLQPGQAFVKTWRVRNTGTCPWRPGTQLVFDTGAQMGAPTSVNVGALDGGQTMDISVNMTAPSADGRYLGYWQFRDPEGGSFGTNLTVVILIGGFTPTASPGPTHTSIPEPSPTPTDTPASQPSPSPTTTPQPQLTATNTPAPTATHAPATIALRNGNFEADWAEESSHRCLVLPAAGQPFEQDVGNIFTPPGWTVWYRHQEGLWTQPECRDAWSVNPNRMRSGAKGFLVFTFGKLHDAGLFQQVNVAPGSRLRFSAWAHAWSNHRDEQRPNAFPHPDDARWSEGAGYEQIAWAEDTQPLTGDPQQDARSNFAFWVGIDPTGGTNPLSSTVVWSQGWHIYNGYVHQLAVEAVAQSSTVTVFLRSRTKWQFKHNDAYWDDAELVSIAE